MNVKHFSDALGELDSRYIQEALHCKKKSGTPAWMRWGAAAACLCLLVIGGMALTRDSGTAAPDPKPVQIPNPILTVSSLEEMESYLDFKVPVLDREAASYSVLVEDGYPVMGQIDYADGSEFRIQYGGGDISGIHGGTSLEGREVAGVNVEYYEYDGTSYAIWEQDGFAFSYVYTDGGSADVEALILQFQDF